MRFATGGGGGGGFTSRPSPSIVPQPTAESECPAIFQQRPKHLTLCPKICSQCPNRLPENVPRSWEDVPRVPGNVPRSLKMSQIRPKIDKNVPISPKKVPFWDVAMALALSLANFFCLSLPQILVNFEPCPSPSEAVLVPK